LIYYRVEGVDPASGDVRYFWETTQINEKNRRKALADKGFTEVSMTEMDVPTDKPSLTKWLQDNLPKKE
jgi:hypothetical protein